MSALTQRRGRLIIPGYREADMTLTELRKAAVKMLAGDHASPLTISQYEVCWGQFAAWLRDVEKLRGPDDVRHFTTESVQGFVAWLKDAGALPGTIRNKLSALATLAKAGAQVRDDRGRIVVRESPMQGISWPKAQRRPSKFLYPAELAVFLAYPCPAHLDMPRELFIDTGARVSSLCNATVGDFVQVSSKGWALRLIVKGNREELVPVSQAAAAKLWDYLVGRGITDPIDSRLEPLLVDERGRKWRRTALSEAMVRLGKAAGLTRFRVSAHKLRHTTNVVGRDAGIDEYTRARMLSHTSTATIKVYDHEIPGETLEARERQRAHLETYVGRRGATTPLDARSVAGNTYIAGCGRSGLLAPSTARTEATGG